MNRLTRLVASTLSLSILLSVAAPYQAAAQAVAARVSPVGAIGSVGAAGASVNALGGASLALPAASLPSVSLVPSLTPSAMTPVLAAPAAIAPLAPAASIEAARAYSAAPHALAAAAVPAAATPEKAAAPIPALPVLRTASAALTAASKLAPANDPSATLDALFEGSTAKADTLAVSARAAASDTPRLDPAASREPAKGPRWVKSLRPEGPQPASSLKRTFAVGVLGAVLPLVFTMVTVAVAQLLGHQLHPNYQGPMGAVAPTVLQALAIWVGAAIMAPVSEEAIFRGGLQGTLAKISAKLRLGDFVLPALITAVTFTAVHETSDPVLFGTRLAQALLWSYLYKKEGILSTMASHGIFNGLLAVTVVFTALGAPLLSLAVAPLAIFAVFKARSYLKAQQPGVADGTLKPVGLSAELSVVLAAVLIAGYFLIMPNIIWPIGAAALVYNAVRRVRADK